VFPKGRDEDGFGSRQTGNGTGARRRRVRTGGGDGGGGVGGVRRMRVRDRGQVHHEGVRPVVPRAVSQVHHVRADAGPVVFRVERETVLPPGLRQVSGV